MDRRSSGSSTRRHKFWECISGDLRGRQREGLWGSASWQNLKLSGCRRELRI